MGGALDERDLVLVRVEESRAFAHGSTAGLVERDVVDRRVAVGHAQHLVEELLNRAPGVDRGDADARRVEECLVLEGGEVLPGVADVHGIEFGEGHPAGIRRNSGPADPASEVGGLPDSRRAFDANDAGSPTRRH